MDRGEDRIRQRAYQIWEREGRPEGADLRHWYQAVDEIAEDATASRTSSRSAGDDKLESEWATQATTAPSAPPLFGSDNSRE
ncbi:MULTISPECIES: DUF2934 domain-containing protein [unclassified Sinorhizobium]|uniref:DUF2934 domain-containing protein n=1 Tax=unclassified Sinorhizobium TaxID=2613772 RepID=UPI003525F278